MKVLEPIKVNEVKNLKELLSVSAKLYPDNIAFLDKDLEGSFFQKT